MRLFSYSADDFIQIGLETENHCFNLTKALYIYQKAQGIKEPFSIDYLQVLVESGYCNAELIQDVMENPWVQSKSVEISIPEQFVFHPPIERPSKLICLGRNYSAHAEELNHSLPEEPLFFAKAVSSITAHQSVIHIPAWIKGNVDHEAELAVIIGKEARNIKENETVDYIAGYSIINDITARDMQKNDMNAKEPWFRSKSLDTFCPFGPYIVPAGLISNPHNLEIELKVNGKTRQKSNTKNMIFPISQIIAHISKYMTLIPGDIIATGTPEGVSPVHDGDCIDISISGLGTLTNTVKKDKQEEMN